MTNATVQNKELATSNMADQSEITTSDAVDQAETPCEEILYDLAALFKIFADTTRIKILFALLSDEMNVATIAATVGSSQSAVSHQLRILKQARLVKFRRDGKQVIYSLSDDHVNSILEQGMTHICE